MAIYKRTYKVYEGALTPPQSRFLVLTRYSLATLFESRIFTGFTVLCLLPFLGGLTYIYFAHSETARAILNLRGGDFLKVDVMLFAIVLRVEAFLALILTAWAAPGMVTRDFANQALQLYFSRPLSRTEYVLGKFSVLGILLSVITWIPALLLFLLQAGMEGNGWGWKNLYLVGSIFVGSWLWIAMMTLLSLALSVFVRFRIAATGLIFAVFFVLPGFGFIMSAVLRTPLARLLDLSYAVRVAWGHLFRFDDRYARLWDVNLVPLWSAWAAILTACLIAVWMLNLRLKAREVERG